MNNDLRDQIARAIFEEPGAGLDWSTVSEARRKPWRMDADRVVDVVRLWLCDGNAMIAGGSDIRLSEPDRGLSFTPAQGKTP